MAIGLPGVPDFGHCSKNARVKEKSTEFEEPTHDTLSEGSNIDNNIYPDQLFTHSNTWYIVSYKRYPTYALLFFILFYFFHPIYYLRPSVLSPS